MPRTKRTEGVKWRIIGIRNAGMKHVDIARALNVSQTVVSRLLKKHRETDSVKERKRFSLIIECKVSLNAGIFQTFSFLAFLKHKWSYM